MILYTAGSFQILHYSSLTLRPEKTVAQFWTHMDEVLRKELNSAGLWVDNTQMNIEQTVTYIMIRDEDFRLI